MDKERRKELVEQYKQIKVFMGIFQIRNEENGKIYIGSCSNLKSRWFTLKGQLDMGRFANAELQKAWKEQGETSFTYEVLEEQEIKPETDVKWELKQMEKSWLEEKQPYGEKGYNKRKDD